MSMSGSTTSRISTAAQRGVDDSLIGEHVTLLEWNSRLVRNRKALPEGDSPLMQPM